MDVRQTLWSKMVHVVDLCPGGGRFKHSAKLEKPRNTFTHFCFASHRHLSDPGDSRGRRRRDVRNGSEAGVQHQSGSPIFLSRAIYRSVSFHSLQSTVEITRVGRASHSRSKAAIIFQAQCFFFFFLPK